MLSRTYWVVVILLSIAVVSVGFGIGMTPAALVIGALAFVVFVPLRSVLPESRRFAHATGTRRWVWLVGGALFLGGVWLMHSIGDPTYTADCPLRTTRRCSTGHGWATLLYFTGLFAGVIAASSYPVYRLVTRATETTATRITPGHVIVSGTVASAGEILESPFTDTEAVCYRSAVQERHNERLFADDGSWHTVSVDTECVPFYVEDETGRVFVDPGNATLTLNEVTMMGPVGDVLSSSSEETAIEAAATSDRLYQVDTEHVVDPQETPPPPIADWEEREGLFPLVPRKKKYTEDLLRPGDTVTVAGTAVRVDYGAPERIVVGGDGSATKISAGETEPVTSQLAVAVWVPGILFTLLTPLGLALMVMTL